MVILIALHASIISGESLSCSKNTNSLPPFSGGFFLCFSKIKYYWWTRDKYLELYPFWEKGKNNEKKKTEKSEHAYLKPLCMLHRVHASVITIQQCISGQHSTSRSSNDILIYTRCQEPFGSFYPGKTLSPHPPINILHKKNKSTKIRRDTHSEKELNTEISAHV